MKYIANLPMKMIQMRGSSNIHEKILFEPRVLAIIANICELKCVCSYFVADALAIKFRLSH